MRVWTHRAEEVNLRFKIIQMFSFQMKRFGSVALTAHTLNLTWNNSTKALTRFSMEIFAQTSGLYSAREATLQGPPVPQALLFILLGK